jgi:exo-1,4-beta-D-glucosaminidase
MHVHNAEWKELYSAQAAVDAGEDSSQIVATIPENLYSNAERTFFVDLSLTDAKGNVVSRNFYWLPGTLTSFDWGRTDYTHTPAARHEDMTSLWHLPAAKVNPTEALAFQVSAAVRTKTGRLIAPVIWSDNWVELAPGERRVLTALLPESGAEAPVVQVDSWNGGSQDVTPTASTPQ